MGKALEPKSQGSKHGGIGKHNAWIEEWRQDTEYKGFSELRNGKAPVGTRGLGESGRGQSKDGQKNQD